MSAAIDAAKQREAEQQVIDAIKVECNKLLEALRLAQPPEAERIRATLDEVIKRCSKLPMDFTRKIRDDARAYECTSNTRAADVALQAAMTKAKESDMIERNRLVSQARSYALGADPRFRAAFDRKSEVTMMSGNAVKGPSFAKPAMTVPKSA
jgi:hypothetical protein